jgi:uncharacterized protein involved in high-affinity Fe2+ transport
MPRLVGRQSNNELLAGLVLVVALGAVAVGAEYYGYINLIPEWGKDRTAANSDIKLPLALIPSVRN